MTPDVVDRPAVRLATVRHVGPYHEIGSAFARLEAVLTEAGFPVGPAIMAAVFHDNPQATPAAELRSDAGVVVAPDIGIPAGLTPVDLPAGRYLHLRHLGPYSGLPVAWGSLRRAVLTGGDHRRGDGAGFELYPNNPITTAPDDLITDLYIPLAD